MLKRLMWVFFWLVSLPAAAQNLTLPEAWQIALENNLSLQQQQQNIQIAQKQVQIQKAGYFPSISASALYNHVSEIAILNLPIPGQAGVQGTQVDVYDFNIGLSQPIFTGFRTSNLLKAAREQQQAGVIEEAVLKNQILLQIGMLYYDIQLNLVQQDVFTESIKRVDTQLKRVRNFYFAAQAAAFDTLEVANRKLQLQNELLNLQNIHQILLSNFKFAINTDAPFQIDRPAVEIIDLALAPLSEYYSRAIGQRPELEKITALQQAQLYRTKAAQSVFYPQVSATASYHYFRLGADFSYDEWQDFYTVGLSLNWNIWNWKRDSRTVEQSRLEYRNLDIANQKLLQDIEQQVTEAYKLLDNTRQQIQLQRQLVAQEQERYRIAGEQFEQGQAANLDLTNAERALTEAELLLQQKYIQWYRHKLRLDFAAGEIGK